MKSLTLLFAVALAFTPGLFADGHLDGVQSVRYNALLSPSHQSPPLEGVDASGEARVEITIVREAGEITSALVDFHVNWRAGQVEELRAMHIHQGEAGANGSVVVDADLGPQPASAGGMIFRQTKVMDVELIEEIMANPGGFYVNIHSASSGRGILRGQLNMDASSELKKVRADLQETLHMLDAMIREGFGFPRRN